MKLITDAMTALRDGFANIVSGVGTDKDKAAHWKPVSRIISPAEIDAAYDNDWLSRKIIDIIPDDMTREWRNWQCDEAEDLYAAEKQFHLRTKVHDALVYARKYGGGAILIGTADTDPTQPLDIANFPKGGLAYLQVFHRWELTGDNIITDISNPYYRLPQTYTINSSANRQRIDRSRFVFFTTSSIRNAVGLQQDGWGVPVYQYVQDAVIRANAVHANVSSMTEEAKLDIVKIPDIQQYFADDESEKQLTARLSYANRLKGILGMFVLGGDEEYDTKQLSFGGLPEIINQNFQISCAAADVPMTRMFSQSPAGLNATGESDTRNYYDKIKSSQVNHLQETLDPLDTVFIRHVTGNRTPEQTYEWAPLWQLTQAEVADIGTKVATMLSSISNSGLFAPEELRPAAADVLIALGILPTLDQHMMEEPDFQATLEEQAQQEHQKQIELKTASAAPGQKPNLRLVGRDMRRR